MGRHKTFTVEELWEKWQEFKEKCDNNTINNKVNTINKVTEGKKTTTVKQDHKQSVRSPISYTIEGFCVFLGITRQAFYETYCKENTENLSEEDKEYLDIVELIKEESEVDTRAKFETGQINSRLAPLWMSKYGYSQKCESKVDASMDASDKLSSILEQMQQ